MTLFFRESGPDRCTVGRRYRAPLLNSPPLLSLLLTHAGRWLQDAWTPLHAAAQKGNAEVVGLLLANGVGVNAETDGLRTPLHVASQMGHKAAVELLERTCTQKTAL